MNRIWLLLGILLLTACSSDKEYSLSKTSDDSHTVEMIQPMREPVPAPKNQRQNIPVLKSQATSVEDKAYKEVVASYTKHMDQVITDMSTTMDRETAMKNYENVQKNIKEYKQQKKQVKLSDKMKIVDTVIDEANHEYLNSMDKIVTGMNENNTTLKESGFKQFSKAHERLNLVNFEIADDVSTELPTSEVPSTETIQKEIFTAESPSSESPKTEQTISTET